MASVLALGLVTWAANPAAGQMCSADAGCAPGDASVGDAGSTSDAAVPMSTDAGTASDAGAPDAGDGGMSMDAGGMDASPEPSTAACSCDAELVVDGRIHVCTGSFDAAACRTFTCDPQNGLVRPQRCTSEGARLCCDMPARGLYAHLYDDCTHPNCESGFRAQCTDLGGTVTEGSCEQPDVPDDPDTETGDSGGSICALGRPGSERAGHHTLALILLTPAILLSRRRRAARRSASA